MPEKTAEGLYAQTIDNETYEYAKWNTEDALETLLDMLAVLGHSGGGIAAAVAKSGTLSAELPDATVDAFMGRIADQLVTNRPMVMRIIKRLATHKLLCNGKVVKFDTHYQDRMPHMFMVARYNAEVQYSSFFTVLEGTPGGGLLERFKARKQAAEPIIKTNKAASAP